MIAVAVGDEDIRQIPVLPGDPVAEYARLTEGVRTIPVLDCTALAVFQALFDRTKDWADIEEIVAAGALDLASAVVWLERILGPDSSAVDRLKSLVG